MEFTAFVNRFFMRHLTLSRQCNSHIITMKAIKTSKIKSVDQTVLPGITPTSITTAVTTMEVIIRADNQLSRFVIF